MSDLAELERRVAALTARRDALRARARQRERADDLRRKVLVGACVLARWLDGRMPAEWRPVLDTYLTRPHDRRLFGLDVPVCEPPDGGEPSGGLTRGGAKQARSPPGPAYTPIIQMRRRRSTTAERETWWRRVRLSRRRASGVPGPTPQWFS